MNIQEEKKEKHQHQLKIVVGGQERRMDLESSSEVGSGQVFCWREGRVTAIVLTMQDPRGTPGQR
jgi:hypothetical protein